VFMFYKKNVWSISYETSIPILSFIYSTTLLMI
jgi:hypothetical protein